MSPTENENVIAIKWNGVADCVTYQPSLQKNLRFITQYTGNDVNVVFDREPWKHLQSSLQNGKYSLEGIYAFTSTYYKILIKKIIRMPTVVVRFETCKKATGYGTVYYRIYKGHNRRMEFSFHLHLPTSSWDETTRTIREEHPKACLFCAQIEADLRLLNRIITEDITGRLTMGDMIAQTAKDNNQMNFLTCK